MATKTKDYSKMTIEELQNEIYPPKIDWHKSEEQEFMEDYVYPSLSTTFNHTNE